MTAPTTRTTAHLDLRYFDLPDLIPIGASPPPPPTIDRPPTPLSPIPEVEEPSPEQLKRMMDHWQKKIYEDTMRRKAEDAKDKMFAKVKGNG
jgi:hypothetical protein